MATEEALHRSSRHRYWNVEDRYKEAASRSRSSPFESGRRIINGLPLLPLCCKNKLSDEARDRVFSLTLSSASHHPSPPSLSQTLLLSLSPSPDPLPLALSLSLSPLLPSTQDLPEMCRLRLPGNSTVLLKLQMEALQSRIPLVAFQRGGGAAMLYDHMSFIHMLC